MVRTKVGRFQGCLGILAVVLSVPVLASAQGATPPSAQAPGTKPAADVSKSSGAITARIEGLRNDRGTVYVVVHANQKSFDQNKGGVHHANTRPKQGVAVVVFENVVPGTYAISFIHDENDNKKLDTSFIGIPKEGFGYSKDAMGRFGPPKFDAAAIVVPAGPSTVVMHTKYM